ncbi:hypothetical protein EGW08_013566 [Elysia chlorotica]|uniref:Lengsin n=1 Tax=Elysia chlorotica TaxID=188477 RepID=A0A433TAU2_ELYCH|nr:hypothetical protein EGW08_013566 [Elysia chlorotica]
MKNDVDSSHNHNQSHDHDSLTRFDTVQLSLTCVSGVDRHVMVTAAGLSDIVHQNGTVNFGRGVSSDSLIFDPVSSCGSAKVDMSSLRPLPWLSTEGCRVGGAMCHITPPTKAGSAPPIVSPREAALKQVARLKEEFGLDIKSAFEMEFMVFEKNGTVPFNGSASSFYARIDSWAGREDIFFDICKSLLGAGQPLESLETEMAAGQFEITFAPQRGVASADSVVLVKEGLRKCLGKSEMTPTFMSTPNVEGHSNGFHFNHSLWEVNHNSHLNQNSVENQNINRENEDREPVNAPGMTNAFCDPNKPLYMSSLARHWLAGLTQHGPGLALISSPTINCTRRLQDPLCPKKANWGVENRSAFLRVRNSKSNVYIEDRLPSSACNPYLVLAAVLAAGMDGLRRKLVCPPQMDPDAPPLPSTLDGAVSSLEEDQVLVEALGSDLVSALTSLTRKSIAEKEARGLDRLDRQKEVYFRCI